MATTLINENVNLNEVMSVLGHSSFNTTQRYIHQKIDKMKFDILSAIEK